jgi:hypothetical protein
MVKTAKNLKGTSIAATDGDIGSVQDLYFAKRPTGKSATSRTFWSMTGFGRSATWSWNWWPGRKVLISPEWIKRVSWPDSRVYVDLTREGVKASPEYDPDRPPERDYESRLYRHYGRRSYWE